jgi:hypothetical protein
MSWPSSRGCVTNEWRRVWGLARFGESSLPDCRMPECALHDGLVQAVAVALPGDQIKVDPRTPELALDCVYGRSRMGHANALL